MITARFMDRTIASDFDPAEIEPYFSDYNSDKWESETNGAVFEHGDREGFRVRCAVTHSPDHGFIVDIAQYRGRKYLQGWITVGDEAELSEAVDVGSDEIFYKGNFVAPELAWRVLQAFFNDPDAEPRAQSLRSFTDLPDG